MVTKLRRGKLLVFDDPTPQQYKELGLRDSEYGVQLEGLGNKGIGCCKGFYEGSGLQGLGSRKKMATDIAKCSGIGSLESETGVHFTNSGYWTWPETEVAVQC